jgi:hypothetical protein
MIPVLTVPYTWAATHGTFTVLGGARGNPERTIERSDAGESGELEPAALAAVLASVTSRGDSGFFASASGEAWAYLPGSEASLVRLVPGGGVVREIGSRGHLDGAIRAALEAAPAVPAVDSARVEATASAGIHAGRNAVDLVGTAIDREFPWSPTWTFRTGEAGVAWSSDPVAGATVRLRATGQGNQGYIVEDDYIEAVSGWQVRGLASLRLTGGPLSVEVGYRPTLAFGGDDDNAERPVLTPVGDYDDDADALSAGGFVQHRIEVVGSARLGSSWTLDGVALLRVRDPAPDAPVSGIAQARHLRLDVGRRLADACSLHVAAGWTDVLSDTGVSTLDPTAWVAVRWTAPPARK